MQPLRPLLAVVLGAVPSLGLLLGGAAPPDPGRATLDPDSLLRAELLVSERNCVACHDADAETLADLASKPAPILDAVGARASADWMQAFLLDPHATKPGTTMPDVLGGFGDAERAEIADALVHFLSSLGGPLPDAPSELLGAELERGRELFHTAGCVACHEPQAPAAEFNPELGSAPAPIDFFDDEEEEDVAADPAAAAAAWTPEPVALGDLASKYTLVSLQQFLLDPLAVRPGGRMPDLQLSEGEARSLAAWLLRGQLLAENGGFQQTTGLRYTLYEDTFQGPYAEIEGLEPVDKGVVPVPTIDVPRRDDDFALHFEGEILVPERGSWTFFTTSDDGSRLWIGGELVVDNGGTHAPTEKSGTITLGAGAHPFAVRMFEHGGGEELEVRWEGPGQEKALIPESAFLRRSAFLEPPARLVWDEEKAEFGRGLFTKLGCVSCHDPTGRLANVSPRRGPDLASLGGKGGGCLEPESGALLPDYGFDAEEKSLVSAWLSSGTASRPVAARAGDADPAHRTMARLGCYACHERGGRGGPHDERRDYFTIDGFGELGNEGRIPPALTGVGAKLKEPWLRRVLLEGESVRPYMATRMPRFGEANVGELATTLVAADLPEGGDAEPPFTPEAAEAGHFLVGSKGVGCINCHNIAGHRSTGIPAVDLASVHERIQPAWFERLLWDPGSLNMNTRMPGFWWEGARHFPEVLDGDPKRQIDAIWSYLSLGESMELPEGILIEKGYYDLLPIEGPLMFGTFMRGLSPRVTCVGFPERAHYAFDRENHRLALLWRGEFMDAEGTWHGRAGQLEWPAGTDVHELPPGPAFAILGGDDAAWPDPLALAKSYHAVGWQLDEERRPIFQSRYSETEIRELAFPVLRAGGTAMVRRFTIHADSPQERYLYRAATGDRIERLADGAWLVDGQVRLEFQLPAGVTPRVRDAGSTRELLVPVRFVPADTSGIGPAFVAGFAEERAW